MTVAWREELLALNPWARGITINPNHDAFQAARQKATLERYEQGMEVWNRWANDMLEVKKALEKARLWDAIREGPLPAPPIGRNDPTRDWLDLASAVFSRDLSTHEFETHARCFRDYIFPSDAWFESATFSGYAVFSGASFSDVASFARTTFRGYADFDRATFSRDAQFERATFKDAVSISGATFSALVDFRGATCERAAHLASNQFKGPVFMMGAKFQGPAGFARSVFHKATNFEAIDCQSTFSLADVTFHQVPRFLPKACFTKRVQQ